MTDEKDIKAYGDRVWQQAETVMQNLFADFDRIAEQYKLTDKERLAAVRHHMGDDMHDWYQNWVEESGA